MSQSSATPRPAATVLLLRDGAEGVEVFMVVRHRQIEFAAGALVFPGGSIDQGDGEIAGRAGLCDGTESLDPEALTARVAAIREAFEECGALIARRSGGTDLLSAAELAEIDNAYRKPLCDGSVGFADLLQKENLVLAADQLVLFSRWITPEKMAKRFDTHFFLAIAPDDQVMLHDGREAVDSMWITAEAALAGAKDKRFTIVFPTQRNLMKLARFGTVAEVIEALRREPIFPVMPEMTETATGFRLRIPAEAGSDGGTFDI